jgi:hypothetical protein
MDFEQARNDVLNWITAFVEQPHPGLAGWPPCPFARRARINGEIESRPGRIDPYTDLAHIDIGHHDVVIMIYDPNDITAQEFYEQIRSVNSGFLIPRGLFALGDHPNHPEIVQGVKMNQGTWALAFVQNKKKLEHHARELAARGYYTNWDETYLTELFDQREDPRVAKDD